MRKHYPEYKHIWLREPINMHASENLKKVVLAHFILILENQVRNCWNDIKGKIAQQIIHRNALKILIRPRFFQEIEHNFDDVNHI